MIKQIEKLARRIRNVVAVGRIHSVGDDYRAQSTFLSGETQDETYVAQHYGFSSRPLKDSKCYAVCPGNRQALIIIASDDPRFRPLLESGEVALYSDEGDSIALKRGNTIEIKSKTLEIVHNETKQDLLKILVEVLDTLEKTVVPTMMGPQALSTRPLLAKARENIRKFTSA